MLKFPAHPTHAILTNTQSHPMSRCTSLHFLQAKYQSKKNKKQEQKKKKKKGIHIKIEKKEKKKKKRPVKPRQRRCNDFACSPPSKRAPVKKPYTHTHTLSLSSSLLLFSLPCPCPFIQIHALLVQPALSCPPPLFSQSNPKKFVCKHTHTHNTTHTHGLPALFQPVLSYRPKRHSRRALLPSTSLARI